MRLQKTQIKLKSLIPTQIPGAYVVLCTRGGIVPVLQSSMGKYMFVGERKVGTGRILGFLELCFLKSYPQRRDMFKAYLWYMSTNTIILISTGKEEQILLLIIQKHYITNIILENKMKK